MFYFAKIIHYITKLYFYCNNFNRMKISSLIAFLMLWLLCPMYAQSVKLKGVVRNQSDEPLAFASVYIQGTSQGTNTNPDGEYILDVPANSNLQIVFQYVGYQSQTIAIQTTHARELVQDATLQAVALDVQEIVVTSGEDPAYRIIRAAMEKRKYYLHQVESYECEAYVKGVQRLTKLPEKLFGQDMSEVRNSIDSTGILYLSESVSKLYFNDKAMKEVMTSSKISGDDNGFSFHSGAALQKMSFYENSIDLNGAQLLSPIGAGALAAYRYELISTFLDGSRLVHKIKVEPRNEFAQVFRGYVYIVEGEFCLHSVDLYSTGKSANIAVLDTIWYKQVHVPLQDSTWRLFSEDIILKLNILGIGITGKFVGVFRNYQLNPTWSKKFFNDELFSVKDSANRKDKAYWEQARPIPLTTDEQAEYKLKDSLQQIWKSKPYLDSIDRQHNKFTAQSWLIYSHRNSHKNRLITFRSPLANIQFNTVQGFVFATSLLWQRSYGEYKTRQLSWLAAANYGTADKQLRGTASVQYKFNAIHNNTLSIEGGRSTAQFNDDKPIGAALNDIYTLYVKRNYLKLYDKNFVQIKYAQAIGKGLHLDAAAQYAARSPLTNQSGFVWKYAQTNRPYFSNHYNDFGQPPYDNDTLSFASNQLAQLDIKLRWRIGEKFISYPQRRFYTGSKYPELLLHYRKAFAVNQQFMNFDYVAASVESINKAWGRVGVVSWRLHGGYFIQKSRVSFMDYYHFNGNQTIVAKTNAYLSTFQLLPYYQYSTNDWHAEAHFQYNCNGFLWNKMPLLKKLGFEWVVGGRCLLTPAMQQPYAEFNLGIDRIGWKLFRFLRVDAVAGWQTGTQTWKFGWVMGFNLSL